MSEAVVVRVVLPAPLRALANLEKEIKVEVSGAVTQRSVLDVLEADHPVLKGTIRGHNDAKRRAFVRFFACEEDLSHDDPDDLLPEPVASGREPYIVLGAMAGG
ncbi:MAG: MoaD/ThiS family protein [Nocardioides sp.]